MDQGLGSVFRRDWDKILANFILAIISLVVSISGFYNEYPFGHVITISIGVFVLSILIYINLYKEGLIILRKLWSDNHHLAFRRCRIVFRSWP